MATAPGFAATPAVGSAIANATLDTSLTAPTNVATVVTAAATGTKIDELVVQGLGTTVAGVVNVFRYDGATYHLIDQFLVTAVTSSTTALAYQARRIYENLVLKNGDSLRFTVTVAGLQSLIKMTAWAADF
jgi:hypothetical protein